MIESPNQSLIVWLFHIISFHCWSWWPFLINCCSVMILSWSINRNMRHQCSASTLKLFGSQPNCLWSFYSLRLTQVQPISYLLSCKEMFYPSFTDILNVKMHFSLQSWKFTKYETEECHFWKKCLHLWAIRSYYFIIYQLKCWNFYSGKSRCLLRTWITW